MRFTLAEIYYVANYLFLRFHFFSCLCRNVNWRESRKRIKSSMKILLTPDIWDSWKQYHFLCISSFHFARTRLIFNVSNANSLLAEIDSLQTDPASGIGVLIFPCFFNSYSPSTRRSFDNGRAGKKERGKKNIGRSAEFSSLALSIFTSR